MILINYSRSIVSLIITCITNANGSDRTNPKGPNIKVKPNCDIRVKPGNRFVLFFIIEGIII